MKLLTMVSVMFITIYFSGCANPGIVKMSPDTYLLSRADHGGIFGNTAKLKAGFIKDATEFAESMGKVAIPLHSNSTPVYPGHFATFEYQFRVVDKNDPEARRTSLTPRPDIVIEKKEKIIADIKTEDVSKKKEDLYTELTKLGDLLEKGLLTKEEFNVEKQKLLNSK